MILIVIFWRLHFHKFDMCISKHLSVALKNMTTYVKRLYHWVVALPEKIALLEYYNKNIQLIIYILH